MIDSLESPQLGSNSISFFLPGVIARLWEATNLYLVRLCSKRPHIDHPSTEVSLHLTTITYLPLFYSLVYFPSSYKPLSLLKAYSPSLPRRSFCTFSYPLPVLPPIHLGLLYCRFPFPLATVPYLLRPRPCSSSFCFFIQLLLPAPPQRRHLVFGKRWAPSSPSLAKSHPPITPSLVLCCESFIDLAFKCCVCAPIPPHFFTPSSFPCHIALALSFPFFYWSHTLIV